jgi:integrase
LSNVRKITHRPRRDGSRKVSWRATWMGADGKRRSKNFPRKGDADAHLKLADAGGQGGSPSMSIADLGAAHYRHFDALVKEGVRERGTLDGYGAALDVHLAGDADFARLKLCDLTTPRAQAFLDELFLRAASLDVVKRMRRTLVAWCKFGQRKGWLQSNPAQACVVEATTRPEAGEDRVEIPPKADLAALLHAAASGPAPERDTAIVRVLMFGGLRISELLALADDAVAFSSSAAKLRIRERLERKYVVLGRVKAAKSRRDVPAGPSAARSLKAWRLKRGPAKRFVTTVNGKPTPVPGRLFPAPDGGDLWGYQDFLRDCWRPLMARAGLGEQLKDARGKLRPVTAFGPHALRHVAASLWIEQGLTPKRVQSLLGHSTLALTMDLYGHLWTDDAADEALAQASEQLIPRGAS